jgi:hypothetical protein
MGRRWGYCFDRLDSPEDFMSAQPVRTVQVKPGETFNPDDDFPFRLQLKPGESVRLFADYAEESFETVELQEFHEGVGMTDEELQFAKDHGWIEGNGLVIGGETFRKLSRPIVYVFVYDGIPYYVGMSKQGIIRPCAREHAAAKLREVAEEVRIYPCQSESAAKMLEAFLIGKWKPAWNAVNGTPVPVEVPR